MDFLQGPPDGKRDFNNSGYKIVKHSDFNINITQPVSLKRHDQCLNNIINQRLEYTQLDKQLVLNSTKYSTQIEAMFNRHLFACVF